MRELASVTEFDHILEPSAGRGRLITELPRQQQITLLKFDSSRAANLAMMPHCRQGAMPVCQTNFLNHVGKGSGYFGTFFNAILMTPPRRQNEDLRHVMAAWDCLAPGGTLVAVLSPRLGAPC
jgi:16S rRNA G1207 methylase RsmC